MIQKIRQMDNLDRSGLGKLLSLPPIETPKSDYIPDLYDNPQPISFDRQIDPQDHRLANARIAEIFSN
jgi:hypothetical protein